MPPEPRKLNRTTRPEMVLRSPSSYLLRHETCTPYCGVFSTLPVTPGNDRLGDRESIHLSQPRPDSLYLGVCYQTHLHTISGYRWTCVRGERRPYRLPVGRSRHAAPASIPAVPRPPATRC